MTSEDHSTVRELGPNRIVASIGMLFGGGLSAAMLVVAADLLRGIRLREYATTPQVLSRVFGRAGFWLRAVARRRLPWRRSRDHLGDGVRAGAGIQLEMGRRCAATRRVSIRPHVHRCVIAVGTVFAMIGVDALQLTNVAMALSSAILPLALGPLLVLMNDRRYLGRHCNGWLANGFAVAITGLALILAVVSIPLTIAGR